MTEALFYHLQRVPLEKVLPDLLERSIGRGWRCAVQASEERVRALDDWLWTFGEESFLPHGIEADDGAQQPIVLLTHSGNPNGAAVRFLVDGVALPEDPGVYERLVVLFDGNDEDAVATAREHWKVAKDQGLTATYWQQNEQGRWEKRA
jgi:DNA polymerase-3 subunit chi